MPLMKRCSVCGEYVLSDVCKCGSPAVTALPAKYSPSDNYGEYRRRTIIREYGENGKCRKV